MPQRTTPRSHHGTLQDVSLSQPLHSFVAASPQHLTPPHTWARAMTHTTAKRSPAHACTRQREPQRVPAISTSESLSATAASPQHDRTPRNGLGRVEAQHDSASQLKPENLVSARQRTPARQRKPEHACRKHTAHATAQPDSSPTSDRQALTTWPTTWERARPKHMPQAPHSIKVCRRHAMQHDSASQLRPAHVSARQRTPAHGASHQRANARHIVHAPRASC